MADRMRNLVTPRTDGLKRLADEIAAALARALATLPDPARDDRMLLRPARWRNDGATWSRDDFDVYCRGKCVGRIMKSFPSAAAPWVRSISGGPQGNCVSRDEAMAAFRAAWDARRRDSA